MSFPVVAATNTSSEATNVATHTINLPAGIVAGDLLLAFIAMDGNPSWDTTPAGWSQMRVVGTSPYPLIFHLYGKIATGAEGATISVVTDVNERSAHQTFRISNHRHTNFTTTRPDHSGSSGSSGNVDVANLAPYWVVVDDVLWILAAMSDADTTFSADPSGFGDAIENDSTGAAAGVKLRTVRRNLRALSNDPDPFTNTSRPWGGIQVAIRGTPSGFGRRAFRGGP